MLRLHPLIPIAAAATVLAGCVAPMGIGPGPVQLPSGRRAKSYAAASAGFGAAGSREQFQAEGSTRVQLRHYVSLEGGLIYNTVRDRDPAPKRDSQVVVHSGMPYFRPTFYVKGVSLGVALSGLGMGGGGGGAAWGMIEPRLGYGRDHWTVYASWLRHGSTAVGGSTTEVSSKHWRLGGDYYFRTGGVRLGGAIEITRGDDSIHYSPGEGSNKAGGTWAEEYTMIGVKLRMLTDAM